MTWVRIDPEITRVELLKCLHKAMRALDVLQAYGQLPTTGLGDLAAPTADFIARSQQAMVDAWKVYLDEMNLVIAALIPLLNDQRAASVVGTVGSTAATFGTGSAQPFGSSGGGFGTITVLPDGSREMSITVSEGPRITALRAAAAQGNFAAAPTAQSNIDQMMSNQAGRLVTERLATAQHDALETERGFDLDRDGAVGNSDIGFGRG